ncbi:MAG: LamG domain-containing protein [Deltaproteobacteria bacterium]|nr:LamG domain-containing protein [Deltaproteobacteria bacterium]
MLWVKRLDETGNVYLLEKGYTYDDWYLKLLQNVPSFGVGNRGVVPSFGTVEAPAPETSRTVPRDRWTHLAGVKRGNTLTLYLNGSRSNSETFESLTRAPNDDYITMGSSSVPGFAGLIDDVALWNRALSETQIRNFKDGICRPNPSPPAPTSCIEAPGGLVAWWPGEENLEDIIGGHDEGTLEEGVTYVDGIVGKAIFKPAGVPAPMARIPGSDTLNFENEYTLMAWVRAGEFGTGSVLARGNSYRMGSTGVSSETESGRSLGAGPPYRYRLPIDEWVHIAGVMSSQRSEFYINGTLAGASVFEMPPRLVQEEANSALALSGQRAFNEGSIDEPMIFNRALSQSEIRSIVRAGSYGVCRP